MLWIHIRSTLGQTFLSSGLQFFISKCPYGGGNKNKILTHLAYILQW